MIINSDGVLLKEKEIEMILYELMKIGYVELGEAIQGVRKEKTKIYITTTVLGENK